MTEIPRSPAKRVIAVGSGKGGVGKTTVSLNLALAFKETGAAVGILDADVYGPNVPLMVNLARTKPSKGWTLVYKDPDQRRPRRSRPIERYGLEIMSAGFIVAEDQALTWNSELVSALIHQLLYQVQWSDLDYLIVDLPPGTADLQEKFTAKIPFDGAVIVVTPQDVAHLDARKAINMYRRNGVEVLGAILNMSGLVCPHCAGHVDVFHPVREDRSIWATGIDKLGEIPLSPDMSLAGDTGHPVMVAYPKGPQAQAFREAAALVDLALSKLPPRHLS